MMGIDQIKGKLRLGWRSILSISSLVVAISPRVAAHWAARPIMAALSPVNFL